MDLVFIVQLAQGLTPQLRSSGCVSINTFTTPPQSSTLKRWRTIVAELLLWTAENPEQDSDHVASRGRRNGVLGHGAVREMTSEAGALHWH